MTVEHKSECKDCGKPIGISDATLSDVARRGHSPPERCPDCLRNHNRETATMGAAYVDLVPANGPVTNLKPGRLGYLDRPPRLWRAAGRELEPDLSRYAIKDEGPKGVVEFLRALDNHRVAIVVGPTGSGKSTFLPYRLLAPPTGFENDHFTRHGQVLVTQPRIPATIEIAKYVARDLHGSSVGPGYDIGFLCSEQKKTDARNRLVYLTDGSLLNLIKRNELHRASVVVIDEAHERSINIDLILALMKRQLIIHPHLKLLIVSATIDTDAFRQFYAPSFEVLDWNFPGVQFDVEERYAETNEGQEHLWPAVMPGRVAERAYEVLSAMAAGREERVGDILAFLPGKYPIRSAIRDLQLLIEDDPDLDGQVLVLPLYAELPSSERQRALASVSKRRDKRRRVIVATNVAETSLTVDGVVHVIDSCLVNRSTWDPDSLLETVETFSHSQAGCKQRRGRAGRVQPGVWHCLLTREQFAQLEAHTPPEIVRTPLEAVVLRAQTAGVPDVERLEWVAPGPAAQEIARATRALRTMGALDVDHDITDEGIEIEAMREDVAVGRFLMGADEVGCAPEAALLAAAKELSSIRSLLEWDSAWSPRIKRDVHRVHEALLAPCRDDLDLLGKIWLAIEQDEHGEWAQSAFVDLERWRTVERRRLQLLDQLNVRKRSEDFRSLRLDLLPRVRLLAAELLPDNVYQASEGGFAPLLERVADEDRLAAAELHRGATIRLDEHSVCAERMPSHFACLARTVRKRHLSPFAPPEKEIVASLVLALSEPDLDAAASPELERIRYLRHAAGDGRAASVLADEIYFVGATYERTTTGLGTKLANPQTNAVPVSRSQRDEEDDDETDGDVDELRALRKRVAVPIEEEAGEEPDEVPPELVDESDDEREDSRRARELEEAESDAAERARRQAAQAHWDALLQRAKAAPLLIEERAPVAAGAPALVTGVQLRDGTIKVQIAPADEQSRFESFAATHRDSRTIEVTVIAVDVFRRDGRHYATVQERDTGYELVLSGVELGPDGRDYLAAELKVGETLTLEIDWINEATADVGVSRTAQAERLLESMLGADGRKTIDAVVGEVLRDAIFVFALAADGRPTPIGLRVHGDRLPVRPNSVALGTQCRVDLARHWPKSGVVRVDVRDELEEEMIKQLKRAAARMKIEWDDNSRALVLHKPLTPSMRRQLLKLAAGRLTTDAVALRRFIDRAYRRSNPLRSRVVDVHGLRTLEQYLDQPLRGSVRAVYDNHVQVGNPDVGWWTVAAQYATVDFERPLTEQFAPGAEVTFRCTRVDEELGHPLLNLTEAFQDRRQLPAALVRIGSGRGGVERSLPLGELNARVDVREGGLVVVKGASEEAVAEAIAAVDELVAAPGAVFKVRADLVGRVIGAGGREIQRLRAESGAAVLLFDGDSRTGVLIAETPSAVVRALTMIDDVFDTEVAFTLTSFGTKALTFERWTLATQIRQATQTQIDLVDIRSGQFKLRGKRENVQAALAQIAAAAGGIVSQTPAPSGLSVFDLHDETPIANWRSPDAFRRRPAPAPKPAPTPARPATRRRTSTPVATTRTTTTTTTATRTKHRPLLARLVSFLTNDD